MNGFSIKLFRLIGCILSFLIMDSCGSPDTVQPKPRTPSKWVGTYEVMAKEYRNGVYEPEFGISKLTIVVGDIPHLFVDANAINGGPTGIGPVAEYIISNSDERLSILAPFSAPFRNDTGMEVPGKYSHVDFRFVLYANPATGESMTIVYDSNQEAPDIDTNGYDMITLRGSYTKINDTNHDCRKYQPPCKE